MPHESTIYRWLPRHKEFRELYAHAREAWADAQLEAMLQIAHDGSNDYITKTNKDGSEYEAVNHEAIGRSRLRVDALKWAMARLNKRYSETKNLDVTNSDGSLQNPRDPATIAGEIAKLLMAQRQKMLETAPAGVSDAVFVEVYPDDGSDLC